MLKAVLASKSSTGDHSTITASPMATQCEWMDIVMADATESILWTSGATLVEGVLSEEKVPVPSTLPSIYDLGFDNPVAAIYRFVEHRRLIGFDQLDDPKAFSEVSCKLWAVYTRLTDDEKKRFLYLGDDFIQIFRVQVASHDSDGFSLIVKEKNQKICKLFVGWSASGFQKKTWLAHA